MNKKESHFFTSIRLSYYSLYVKVSFDKKSVQLEESVLRDMCMDVVRSDAHQFISSAVLEHQYVRSKLEKREHISACDFVFEYWFR